MRTVLLVSVVMFICSYITFSISAFLAANKAFGCFREVAISKHIMTRSIFGCHGRWSA